MGVVVVGDFGCGCTILVGKGCKKIELEVRPDPPGGDLVAKSATIVNNLTMGSEPFVSAKHPHFTPQM